MYEINTKCDWKSPIWIIKFSSRDELTAEAWSLSLVLITVFYTFCLLRKHVGLINNQPADSAVGCSEIILMAARNIRVFKVRVHVCMDMIELENIVRCSPSPIKYVFRLEENVSLVIGQNLGPVHANPFSNENGAVLLRIRLSPTLQRRKGSPKTEAFENALQSGAIWKRCSMKTLFSSVDGENDAMLYRKPIYWSAHASSSFKHAHWGYKSVFKTDTAW